MRGGETERWRDCEVETQSERWRHRGGDTEVESESERWRVRVRE